MQVKLIGYPFVSHVDQNLRPELNIDIKSIYQSKHHLYLNMLHSCGVIRNMGYSFDVRSHLKKFVCKQYGSWQEYYAPNKTLLRESLYGRVEMIVEIK